MNDNIEKKNRNHSLRPKTIVFCGNSKLPENVTAKHIYGFLAIEAEVDPVDLKIVDVSCTLMPSLGEKILVDALIGQELEQGIKNAIEDVDTRFYSTTKRAIIAAVEDLYKRYLEYKAATGGDVSKSRHK